MIPLQPTDFYMYDVYTVIHDKTWIFIIFIIIIIIWLFRLFLDGGSFTCKECLTLSESLLELLDEIENCDFENDAKLHKYWPEQAICSLHLILPILPVDSESSQIVQQLLQNLHIL